jgi:uncharacterized protein
MAATSVVLASSANDPLMGAIIACLARADVLVVTVDLEPARNDDSVHERQLRSALAEIARPETSIIGGFSLGARIAAGLCQDVAARGLLCFGYPFHRLGAPRERHGLDALRGLETPTRIIQGTRDNHGTAVEVQSYALPDSVEMIWLEDGNHRFVPRNRSGHTAEQHIAAAAASALDFIASCNER